MFFTPTLSFLGAFLSSVEWTNASVVKINTNVNVGAHDMIHLHLEPILEKRIFVFRNIKHMKYAETVLIHSIYVES